MSTSDLVELALINDISLKRIMKEGLAKVEDVPYLTEDRWIRSSGFPALCPREEVLCSKMRLDRSRTISSDLEVIFNHGHGLHSQLQNSILPKLGVLRGKWICNKCGEMSGGAIREGVKVEEWATPCPDRCEHCCNIDYDDCYEYDSEVSDFRFHEAKLTNHNYRISGHCDGFLDIPGMPGLGALEAKSIGPGWKIQNVPQLDHVIQLQTYLWLVDLQWGIILYWEKGLNGIQAFTEHFVMRDEDTITNIKETLRGIWEGVAGGPLPDKICETYDCIRAKSCVVREECFGKVDVRSK